MGPYKSKASTTTAPVISNENATHLDIGTRAFVFKHCQARGHFHSHRGHLSEPLGAGLLFLVSARKRHHLRAKGHQLKDKNIASAL